MRVRQVRGFMKPVKPFAACRGSLVPMMIGLFDLAIDPGATTGWAFFDPDHLLLACGTGEPPNVALGQLVIELPQSYPSHPVPPQDLIQLAFLAGRYVGWEDETTEAKTLFPHEWKGNLSKEVCAARVRSKLRGNELNVLAECEADVPKGAMHNVMDAIGIGLFAFRGIKL